MLQPDENRPAPEDNKPLDENDRLFIELRKDPEFRKYRNLYLVLLVAGGGALFGVVWMMLNKSASLLDGITAIVLFGGATVFINRRLSRMRDAVQERLKREDQARAMWGQPPLNPTPGDE